MKRRWRGIVGRSSWLLLAVAAGLAVAQPPAEVHAGKQGFLFEVTAPAGHDGADLSGDSRLVLFGTIHVDRPDAVVLNQQSLAELGHARRLALEADPRDTTTLMRVLREFAFYPAGDGLSRHVSSDVLATARRLGTQLSLATSSVESSKPWFLANYFATLTLLNAGFSPEKGSEDTLARVASQHAIPVVEIEGFERQLGIFDQESPLLQQAQLEESIDDINTGRLLEGAESLVRAWHGSDQNELVAELDALGQGDKLFARFTLDHLIVGRDHTMADRAEEYLHQGGTTFFAVGCLHLFGDSGLVAELRRRGYQVRDLQ